MSPSSMQKLFVCFFCLFFWYTVVLFLYGSFFFVFFLKLITIFSSLMIRLEDAGFWDALSLTQRWSALVLTFLMGNLVFLDQDIKKLGITSKRATEFETLTQFERVYYGQNRSKPPRISWKEKPYFHQGHQGSPPLWTEFLTLEAAQTSWLSTSGLDFLNKDATKVRNIWRQNLCTQLRAWEDCGGLFFELSEGTAQKRTQGDPTPPSVGSGQPLGAEQVDRGFWFTALMKGQWTDMPRGLWEAPWKVWAAHSFCWLTAACPPSPGEAGLSGSISSYSCPLASGWVWSRRWQETRGREESEVRHLPGAPASSGSLGWHASLCQRGQGSWWRPSPDTCFSGPSQLAPPFPLPPGPAPSP